jgi:hypothetical protein
MLTKSDLLSGLHTEYGRWEALLAQIGKENMNTPGAAGPWSIKDIVGHITGWRKRTLARLQAAQRGELGEPTPPWPAHLQEDDEINAWLYEESRGRTVAQVLDESRQVYERLLAAIEAFPEAELMDPRRFAWMEGQQLTAAGLFAHFRDEHEAHMRAWLDRIQEQS